MISIIIPIYNTEKYLQRCLDSIICQFNENDGEILLVNDGSLDKSEQICLEYANKYSFIKYLYKKNGGLSSARNYGIDNAKCEYLFFIDSDDSLKDGLIAYIQKILNKNNDVDILTFSLVKKFSNGKEKELIIDNIVMQDTNKMLYYIFNNKGAETYACNKIFHRKLFVNLQFPYGKLYEDMYLIPQLFMFSKKVIFSCFIGYVYYIHEQSITASKIDYNQFYNIRNRLMIFRKIKNTKDTDTKLLSKINEVVVNGFLSTGFKITSEQDLKIKEYFYKKLKKIISIYIFSNLFLFVKSFKFKQYIALFLLYFMPIIFHKLYKIQQGC